MLIHGQRNYSPPLTYSYEQLSNIRYNYGDPTKIVHTFRAGIWVVRSFEAIMPEIDYRYDSIENPPFPRSSTVKLWKVLLLCDRLGDRIATGIMISAWIIFCASVEIHAIRKLRMCSSLLGSAHTFRWLVRLLWTRTDSLMFGFFKIGGAACSSNISFSQ